MTDQPPQPHTATETAQRDHRRICGAAVAVLAITATLGAALALIVIGFGWAIEQGLRAGYIQ